MVHQLLRAVFGESILMGLSLLLWVAPHPLAIFLETAVLLQVPERVLQHTFPSTPPITFTLERYFLPSFASLATRQASYLLLPASQGRLRLLEMELPLQMHVSRAQWASLLQEILCT